jgi:type IV pilus assembly protein PilB
MARTPIGQLLREQGRIDEYQLSSALAHQRRWGGRIGEALVGLGFVPEPVLLAAVAGQLDVPYFQIGDREIPPDVIRIVPRPIVERLRILPVAVLPASRRGLLVVAFACDMDVKPVLAGEADIGRAIQRHLGSGPAEQLRPIDLPRDEGVMQVVPFAHGLNGMN